jgi:hypothetical protein
MLTLHKAKIVFPRKDLGTLVFVCRPAKNDAAPLGDDTAPLGGLVCWLVGGWGWRWYYERLHQGSTVKWISN